MEQNQVLKHPARIWTFDGGGSSVISQLVIVNEIMHQIQWMLKLDSVPRPGEYAELMVGSGLGAVTVILLARLCLTAEQTLIHLVELGQSVFLEPNESTDGYRFDVERLRMWITNLLQQHALTETTKMIEDALTSGQTYAAITSTPTSNVSHCRLIRSYRTPGAEYNCTIIEAVLATMSNPEWFPPIKIGPVYSQESFTGGVLTFSNPTMQALDEAKRIFGNESKASIVLSLGSGRRLPRGADRTTTDGSRQALDDMSQNALQTANELSQRFKDSIFYKRFSVDSGLETTSISGWTNDDLGAITSHTKVYIEEVSSSLSTTVEILIKNEGSVTLGQLTQLDVRPANAKSIPRLSPFFIERNDVLNFMEKQLFHDPSNFQRMFVIYGMGGSGKTQTASCFARRNKNRYKYILFIDSSSEATIKADLQSAIRSLGGVHSQDSYEDTLRFLAQIENRDWLVIFDNADDPNLPLAMYLPECDHGTIIITGRNRALAELAPTSHWHLQGMDELVSIEVLFKAAKREGSRTEEELKAATELYRLLGGLPLALVHVGSYCHMTMVSVSQYLERFKAHRSKLMAIQPPLQLDQYSYSTYASIGLSYSLLDEYARGLLHLLTFFHSSSIYLDILRTASNYGFRVIKEWEQLSRNDQYDDQLDALRHLLMPDGSWSDVYVDSLLNQLQTFSLITLSHSNGQINITIHPLVQSCILDSLSSIDYSLYSHMAVFVLSSCGRDEEITLFQHLPVHIAALESCTEGFHPNDLACLAYIIFINGNHAEAMKRWEKVRNEYRMVNGEDKSTLRMSYRIADCLYRMSKHEEAEAVIREVVVPQERALGADDDNTLESYRLLARILSKQQKTEEAETILRRILTVSKNKNGQEHQKTLTIHRSLAANLFDQRRYSEAEEISRSVLPALKKLLGEYNPITLDTWSTFSCALIKQGKWTEAEDTLNEKIAKETISYGKHHPNTLNSLFKFTLCLIQREKLDEAESILREVLEIQEKRLKKDHRYNIRTRERLGYIMRQKQLLHSNNILPPILPNLSPRVARISTSKSKINPVQLESTRDLASRNSLISKRRSVLDSVCYFFNF